MFPVFPYQYRLWSVEWGAFHGFCVTCSEYMCMRVCMYVYVYVCMYVCMYECMHVCMYGCMSVSLCLCVWDSRAQTVSSRQWSKETKLSHVGQLHMMLGVAACTGGLGSTLFPEALVQALTSLDFKIENDSPNTMISTLKPRWDKKSQKLGVWRRHIGLKEGKLPAFPSIVQLLSNFLCQPLENKVGPQEENASSERWKKQKLFQANLGWWCFQTKFPNKHCTNEKNSSQDASTLPAGHVPSAHVGRNHSRPASWWVCEVLMIWWTADSLLELTKPQHAHRSWLGLEIIQAEKLRQHVKHVLNLQVEKKHDGLQSPEAANMLSGAQSPLQKNIDVLKNEVYECSMSDLHFLAKTGWRHFPSSMWLVVISRYFATTSFWNGCGFILFDGYTTP